MKRSLYVMYDGRARTGDISEATVMDTANSVEEVRASNQSHEGEDFVWFEYQLINDRLEDPKRRHDLEPRRSVEHSVDLGGEGGGA